MKLSAVFVVISAILVVFTTSQAQAQNFKVVCYFTNWSWYRTGNGKFAPDNIDPKLCTHIVYGFTTLDPNSLTIKIHDSWVDTDKPQNFFKRVTDFRQKGVKVTVAIGGWNDSIGSKYGRLLTDPNARRKFITNAVDFIKKHNFQGLDLDLEYPVCWQGNCSPANAAQKAGFAQFVHELSQAFKPHGWLLSAAVSASSKIIDAGYDVPKLAQHLDWIGVMAYDFHGQWDHKTGPNAPLYNYPGNANNFYADFAVKHWIQKGAPSRKIVMGAPCYGQSFTLANAANHGLNAPSSGGGQPGPFTKLAGTLAYYEICDKVKHQGWTVVHNPKTGPYAFKGNQWVGYDDVETIRLKSKYIRDSKLGGALIWALDMDDFRGTCGQGKYPLLSALNQGLRH